MTDLSSVRFYLATARQWLEPLPLYLLWLGFALFVALPLAVVSALALVAILWGFVTY